MTPTFTKSFSFLNGVNNFFFRRNKQEPGTIKLSESVRLMGVLILLKAKALAPINARRVLESG